MNLLNFINRGISGCKETEIQRASEKARKQWIDSLTSDEIRAWLNLEQSDSSVLFGLTIGLSAAAFAAAYDAGTEDSPDVRVIRGALSAIDQAGHNSSHLAKDTVLAISSAATRAREVLAHCTRDAIYQASLLVNRGISIANRSKPSVQH